jgi:pimeloyl-ACP methyl ester carboxylesterase
MKEKAEGGGTVSLKLNGNVKFKEDLKHYEVAEGIQLYTRIVTKEKGSRTEAKEKTALYIHGGGSGGNHTMLLRPGKWLIEQNFFDKVILLDRRGEGFSTPLTNKLTLRDHATDMKGLLDVLKINEKITVIGISYGGPIALELAGMDERIDEVILMASSPSLKEVKGIQGLLYRYGLLEKITKSFYKKNLGKLPIEYPDFEGVYDLETNRALTRYFVEAIKKTGGDQLESLMFQNASTLDKANSGISKEISLKIPIYQVIGTKDEIWETDLKAYQNRFPHIITHSVEGEKHKGVILNATPFYEGLRTIYPNKSSERESIG